VLFRRERIGFSKGYSLLRAGEVDAFLVGSRRYVLLASWGQFLERQRLGLERDPTAKAAAARRYAETAAASRERYASKTTRIGAKRGDQ
jgi:hypothetical protein